VKSWMGLDIAYAPPSVVAVVAAAPASSASLWGSMQASGRAARQRSHGRRSLHLRGARVAAKVSDRLRLRSQVSGFAVGIARAAVSRCTCAGAVVGTDSGRRALAYGYIRYRQKRIGIQCLVTSLRWYVD
jgi:hypothetical protein